MADLPNFIVIYVLLLIFVYSPIAAYSYAYYVFKSHASIEVRNEFQSTLKRPAKWLFRGKRPFIEYLLFREKRAAKNFEEFLEKTTLGYIQLGRIGGTIICLLIIVGAPLLILYVKQYPLYDILTFQDIVFLFIQLITLIASFCFGHQLLSMTELGYAAKPESHKQAL